MFKEGRTGQDYKTYQLIGLLLGPFAFAALYLSPAPAGLSAPGTSRRSFQAKKLLQIFPAAFFCSVGLRRIGEPPQVAHIRNRFVRLIRAEMFPNSLGQGAKPR